MPHCLRSFFDFGAKPLQRVIPEDIGIPLLEYVDHIETYEGPGSLYHY